MARKPIKSSVVRANNYKPTQMTLATLRRIEERGYRPINRLHSASESYIHDLSSPSYSWLLPGWLAEERVVSSGRVYKYYYDPAGRQYEFKYEVLLQWQKVGLIVIED